MIALLLSVAAAQAAPVLVTFCARLDVAYSDADSSVGDDLLTSDGTYPASGVHIGAWQNATYPNVPVNMYYGYTPSSGASEGCTSQLTLDSTKTYRVTAWSKANIDGDVVKVWSDLSHTTLYTYGPSNYSPPPGGPFTHTFASPIWPWWNTLLAARYGVQRNPPPGDETYDFVIDETGTMGWDDSNDHVVVTTIGANRKYKILHEMGHMDLGRAGGGLPALDTSADHDSAEGDGGTVCAGPGDGPPTHLLEKEYQSAAAWEGIADWYMVNAFNTSGCRFMYWRDADWTCDGAESETNEGATSDPIVDCGAAMSPPDDANYLSDCCVENINDRAIEFDWLRFWYDLTQDAALEFVDCREIWADADPTTWDAQGVGDGDDVPESRLYDACKANGVSATTLNGPYNLNGVYQ